MTLSEYASSFFFETSPDHFECIGMFGDGC